MEAAPVFCPGCPNHNACLDMGGCLKEIRKAIKPGTKSKKPQMRRFDASVTTEEYDDGTVLIQVNGHDVVCISSSLLTDYGLTDETVVNGKAVSIRVLNAVAYEVWAGWMAYFKGRNGRNEKTLIGRLQKAREILESVDMWPPRVEP